MGKKIIKIDLSEKGLAKAIKEIEQYKNDIVQKTNTLRIRVAKYIADTAQSGFNGAIVDDLLKGGVKTAQVDVGITDQGNVSIVVANGEDAIWAEFGSGVTHNGSAGSSPHPKGQSLGFTIGGYGKGMGKKKTWGYYENEKLVLTRGAPASMPLYNALKTTCDEIAIIAKEVFNQ